MLCVCVHLQEGVARKQKWRRDKREIANLQSSLHENKLKIVSNQFGFVLRMRAVKLWPVE